MDDENENTGESFAESFAAAFSSEPLLQSRRAELATGGYFVFAACKEDMLSYSTAKYGGLCTYGLGLGGGWDPVNKVPCYAYASNGDPVVTIEESFRYAYGKASAMAVSGGAIQYVQVWPDDCSWFAWLR